MLESKTGCLFMAIESKSIKRCSKPSAVTVEDSEVEEIPPGQTEGLVGCQTCHFFLGLTENCKFLDNCLGCITNFLL